MKVEGLRLKDICPHYSLGKVKFLHIGETVELADLKAYPLDVIVALLEKQDAWGRSFYALSVSRFLKDLKKVKGEKLSVVIINS
jgi:hypothetical protein